MATPAHSTTPCILPFPSSGRALPRNPIRHTADLPPGIASLSRHRADRARAQHRANVTRDADLIAGTAGCEHTAATMLALALWAAAAPDVRSRAFSHLLLTLDRDPMNAAAAIALSGISRAGL